jgi:hypothetical protein
MFLRKAKATAVAGVGLAVLGLAAGLWAYRPATADTPPRRAEPALAPEAHEGRPGKGHHPERPVGTWHRSVEGCQVTLHVEGDRLTGTARVTEGGKGLVLSLRGDYSVTKDSVLYGVITDLECKEGGEKKAEESFLFIDQPFSARYRVDGEVLIVKDLRFGEFGLAGKDKNSELALLLGRYKKKPGGGQAP